MFNRLWELKVKVLLDINMNFLMISYKFIQIVPNPGAECQKITQPQQLKKANISRTFGHKKYSSKHHL